MRQEHPDLEVETIEVTTNPMKAWKEGIRGFPALKIGDDILSGFILTADKVRGFIKQHLESGS